MAIFLLLMAGSLTLSFLVNVWWLISTAIIVAIWSIVVYSFKENHVDDVFCVRKFKKQRHIYQKMADDLIPKFTSLLGDKFPSIEKDIFNSISVKDIDIFITKYPEIKSDKTIMALVSLINDKTTEMYSCDLQGETLISRINARRENAKNWLPSFLFPKLPISQGDKNEITK
jgi:hypothetical protein